MSTKPLLDKSVDISTLEEISTAISAQ